MNIRAATPDDALMISTVHAACFPEGWSAEAFAGLIAEPGCVALIADDSAGFILVRVAADEAEIITLAVQPDARGKGLGRALLEAACDRAAALDSRTLFLEVAADNAAALALYSAAGFQPAGARPAYYARPGGSRADGLILKRALNT
ncbi:MAG: ribosomal protein S18-alanine N-acetyltransferase, partial [Caulobacteraceae bacterium]